MNTVEQRSRRVDSLRAVALLGVVVAHGYYHRPVSAETLVERTMVLGTAASPFILFVLSGCLLYLPFARRDLAGGNPVSLRRFATHRALRILPLYFVVLAVVMILKADGGTARDWAIYSTFSQNFVYFPNEQLDRSMWFLVIEFQFYLLLPLLARVVATAAGGSRRRAALCLAALAGLSYATYHYAWLVAATPNATWRFSILSHFFYIAAGMLLAVLKVSWEQRRPSWLDGPLGATDPWGIAAAACVAVIVAQGLTLPSADAVACIVLIAVLLVGVCVLPLRPGLLSRMLQWRPLAFLGVASYSLYLWHDPILQVLSERLPAEAGATGLLAVGVPLCCLVAIVSYLLVERPFLRLRPGQAPATPTQRPRAALLTTAGLAVSLALALTLAVRPQAPASPGEPPAEGFSNGVVLQERAE